MSVVALAGLVCAVAMPTFDVSAVFAFLRLGWTMVRTRRGVLLDAVRLTALASVDMHVLISVDWSRDLFRLLAQAPVHLKFLSSSLFLVC